MDAADLQRFAFGKGPEMADWLLGLVLEGKKTATCWAAERSSLITPVGTRYVMLDGQGRGRAILETVELTHRRFDDVDASFAYDEGEDDRTLESWRRGHQAYFTEDGTFAPDMLLCCERFRLVDVLDGAQP